MGHDKASLRVGGETLLERAVRLLARAGAEVVLVSGGSDSRAVRDLLPDRGPAGAVYSLLDHIGQRHGLDGSPLLLIPVDMPLLTEVTLRRLVDGAGDAGCIHFEGEVLPCVLRATLELWTHLRDTFSEGAAAVRDRSLRSILDRFGAVRIPIPAQCCTEFMNVNTPDEWRTAKAALANSP